MCLQFFTKFKNMVKRKGRKSYSESDLLDAIADIRVNKISQRQASKKYGIPKTTLSDRLSRKCGATTLKPGKKEITSNNVFHEKFCWSVHTFTWNNIVLIKY